MFLHHQELTFGLTPWANLGSLFRPFLRGSQGSTSTPGKLSAFFNLQIAGS